MGGSTTSQDAPGPAAGFIAPQSGTARSIASYLMSRLPEIRAGQLIYKGTWVHIGFVPQAPRGECAPRTLPPRAG